MTPICIRYEPYGSAMKNKIKKQKPAVAQFCKVKDFPLRHGLIAAGLIDLLKVTAFHHSDRDPFSFD